MQTLILDDISQSAGEPVEFKASAVRKALIFMSKSGEIAPGRVYRVLDGRGGGMKIGIPPGEYNVGDPDKIKVSTTVSEQKYPSLGAMAKNLVKEAGKTASRAVRGKTVTVPKEVSEERLAICQACEFFDNKKSRCKKCGCKMPYKVGLASGRCPLPEPKWVEWDGPQPEGA